MFDINSKSYCVHSKGMSIQNLNFRTIFMVSLVLLADNKKLLKIPLFLHQDTFS